MRVDLKCHCDGCGTRFHPSDLIPVVDYQVMLCRYCHLELLKAEDKADERRTHEPIQLCPTGYVC